MIQRIKIISAREDSLKHSINEKQIQEKSLERIREEVVEQIKDKICGTDFENEAERVKFQEKIERKIN